MMSLSLPFDTMFRESIKLSMNWDDNQFNKFCNYWNNAHSTYITDQRKSYIYTNKYFETLLDLFFTKIQLDLTNKIVDRKAILITILIFYLVDDTKLYHQNLQSIDIIKTFLNTLLDVKLISITCRNKILSFLYCFNSAFDLTLVDTIIQSDLNFLQDLLSSTDPIIIKNGHTMFYYENPREAIFLVKKPYPEHNEFFDAMFNRSNMILDESLRKIYVDRLYKLMNAQAKKNIFPF